MQEEMIYHKRKESQIVTDILRYLRAQESFGSILWFTRLNSGVFKTDKFFVRGCRAGTPDILIVLNDSVGTVLWVEVKAQGGVIQENQKRFKISFANRLAHKHIFAYCTDDVREALDKYGNT
jgi:VRR-NUC domain